MNYTRPNITEGKWTIHNDGLDFTLTGVSHGCTQFVCRVDASETQGKAEGEANARAISALPQVLAALESAYNRACEAVEKHFYSRGRMRKQVWHSEENTRKQLEAIRDEYKTALTAAGYSFQ